MITIGVLGLQGAVREHVRSIEISGAAAVVVKKAEQLEGIDGLIIPGGESTTMRKLMNQYGFMEPLREFARKRKPIFGTCAGLIILAKHIEGFEEPHLGVLNVTVARNSFGRQIDSFEADLEIKGMEDPFTAVFIRAPHIIEAGEGAEVLAEYNGRIVAAREGQFLGCSFHPELTDDHRLTELFIEMIKESLRAKAV
ncbi:pyridoxal 5'-phosphate synthase glutaminase subunit PdxT [Peribacillus cavernae]|uniref:Pyridoxal 5'-phosphate synthase subunit PdxT n=1 Tax=Peribacillus cavernae TaxID=1674310 RepID=A0A3S1B5T4_9BACI|nr:pyridoxal 5'-phosphate synthase glutaminase subunit PdxT [Peribacillus cavernae]MDQ0221413.1 5'-phosphate synthase pdxT subunit [Peribacillus cavernae]RUQ29134.1 pyridoxal 5'-phosphate synthase glutaminase subunit PdxT [Peribacillus cavernae]